jgi:RNA polymerase sigma factor (sigma-70 family)
MVTATAEEIGVHSMTMSGSSSNEPSSGPLPYAPGRTAIWNNSWRRIYDQFANAILLYARRRGLNDHSAQDVLQEVMLTLIRCQQAPDSNYDPAAGTFQAWLWGIIRNRVRAIRRKDGRETVLSPLSPTDLDNEGTPTLPEMPQAPTDLGQVEEEQWQQALLAAALLRVQARVTPENFSIYTALLEKRTTVEALSQTHGKKPNAIYAVKHRCEEILLVEARVIKTAWEQLRSTSIK